MDIQTIYNIFVTVVAIAIGGLSLYLKTSAKAQAKAKEVQETMALIMGEAVVYIRKAEEDYKDSTKKGGEKFEEVVDKLYSLVPDALKPIITEDRIKDIVQSTFDEVENYVKLQLDDAVDKVDVKPKTTKTKLKKK
mgnify:CR=1 FL=1